MGILTLASCKKTVQPSAFTPDSTPFSATFVGSVQYKINGANIPASGEYTIVTAQLMSGSDPVKDWTFSVAPDANGQYSLTVPMKKGDKAQKYTIKATVTPAALEATFKGSVTVESVDPGAVKTVNAIVCKIEAP